MMANRAKMAADLAGPDVPSLDFWAEASTQKNIGVAGLHSQTGHFKLVPHFNHHLAWGQTVGTFVQIMGNTIYHLGN